MAAFGPPGLTIQLWVDDGSAARAWYQRLFGRPPDFTPFGDDTLPSCGGVRLFAQRAGWVAACSSSATGRPIRTVLRHQQLHLMPPG